MSTKPYHHGALREALVAEALALLQTRGANELSVREIARNIGVTATAAYRYFDGKDALLRELARHGLDQLAEAQHAAWDAAGGGVAGFDATGRAYVRFALDNPALFRLTFAHVGAELPMARAPGAMSEPMSFLLANAATLCPPGRDPALYALQAWAMVHGLAMLMLDGQIAPDPQLLERAIDLSAEFEHQR